MVALHEYPQNLKFLTVRQQKIILEMYNNGNRVSFSYQDVYSSNRAFKSAMRELVKAGCCNATIEKVNGRYRNVYELTLIGTVFCESVIIEFIKSNC